VQDSVSSPITKRVYNLGLDEFFACLSIAVSRERRGPALRANRLCGSVASGEVGYTVLRQPRCSHPALP
jgi:hypothetical protein